VEVEDITGVSLTTWGTTKQKRHLTVGNGLLGQIIEDDQSVLAVITEVLSDSASREGSEVLKRSGLGGGGSDDDGVLHGIVLLEGLDELGDGGTLLTNGDVDTVQLLGLLGAIVPLLLVKNGVEGDGGLSGLTITNNQLTLTTTDGDHGVNALDTSQHGLTDGLTGENTGGLDLGTATLRGGDGALSIDGVTEGIDDTAQKSLTDGEIDNVTGTLDGITLANETIVTEDDNTDVVSLQVHGHTLDTAGELNHLLGLAVLQTVDTGNTVSNGQDTAGLLDIDGGVEAADAVLEDGGDLRGGRLSGGIVAEGREGTDVGANHGGAAGQGDGSGAGSTAERSEHGG
jgi:hypothetical protein